jgi:hypothetical protein
MRTFIPRAAVAALLAAAVAVPACTVVQIGPVSDCVEAPTDERGNPTAFPDGDSTTEVVSMTGNVKTLHPTHDTSTDDWYAGWMAEPDACPTLGGIIPPAEVADIPGVTDEVELNADLDSLAATLAAIPPPPALPIPAPVPVFRGDSICKLANCTGSLPPGPFGSRDIIYVHGLDTGPMLDAITGTQLPAWPADPTAFLPGTGYWRIGAKAYWHTHVKNLLDPRSMTNRVLYVGWSSLQTMEYAAHTVLAQIAGAMNSGAGVVVRDPQDPRGTSGFCIPECIVISHSTGGPVADVALALAHNPGINPNPAFTAAFTNAGYIPAHIRVHVSLGGAFSGSQYATAALALATVGGSPGLCEPAKLLLGLGSSDPCPDFKPLANSMLRDLHPPAMQQTWGSVIRQTPVPVLTIAGGHEDNHWAIKRFVADGFDDGVITMDSGCGRTAPVLAWPSGYDPSAWRRVYDMGIVAHRARRFFAEQRVEPMLSQVPTPRASAACTKWKSPTGMIQPLAATPLFPLSPDVFYQNHYSFVQAAESHVDGLLDCKERPAEDVLAVRSSFVYSVVNTAIVAIEEEVVRGKKIGTKKKKWWIWKRTYHLLGGWGQDCAADYAYRYVLS